MTRSLLFLAILALLGGCESRSKTTSESERRAREAATRLEGASATTVHEAERAANAAETEVEAASTVAVRNAESAMHAAKARFEGTFSSAERRAVHDRFARPGLAPGGRLGPSETEHAASDRSASVGTARPSQAAPPLATTSARIAPPTDATNVTEPTRGTTRGVRPSPTLTLSPVRGAENPSGVANAYPAAPEWTVSRPRATAPSGATIETGGPAVVATPPQDGVTSPRGPSGGP